ncbi:COP9 signalosome, subunit CSN4 [Ceraceosorus bombacis]|uniref:COP9 signalosome, subunit CSN4 n=1 Tax=Ceraceosorus bombacis TaxID=401625 RepID=A0A0P1BLP9_9BASI|nr:COP9 signalosome, subunit CSN4 [Ceraceosorus bombacis]
MALEKVTARVLSFEEQTSSLRLHLADLLENDEEWAEAAGVLQGIPLDSGHRSVSDLVKLRILIRIVRLLLESDDSVAADVSLKRASLIVHNVPGAVPALPGTESEVPQTSAEALQEGKQLGLMYKFCQARIYDAQRRFLDAATRFHDLSYVTDIPESEREKMLSAAVTASILSPAGPQRSRILATLMRDERSASLEQHTILSRVFLDQIVRPAEIETFAKLLAPHQRAALPPTSNEAAVASVSAEGDVEMSEGASPAQLNTSTRTGPSTVLDRAMIEHNIIAASRIYSNITIAGLGALLDLSSVGEQ